MRDYQIKGFQWMATLYENGINGILADEMGLGKTIQTIALFCHLIELDVQGPFLVIAPLSTIKNWEREFNRFAPDVPCVVYHGNPTERMQLRKKLKAAKKIDGIKTPVRYVFLTSYEIAINDRPHFRNVSWRYIVVDEGHRLKNHNCKLIKELKQYESVNRMLLTGRFSRF
jgi:ATP-dependent DNA helicase